MKYLMDTHAIIWHFEGSLKFTPTVNKIIDNSKIFISAVSLWEITIKLTLKKLSVSFTISELLNDIKRRDLTILQIENTYVTVSKF